MRLRHVVLQVTFLLEPGIAKFTLQIMASTKDCCDTHTWNGRSPVWLSIWTLRVVCLPNDLPHSLQGKFFSPKCTTLMCKSIALFDPYAFPHDPQTKSLIPAWDLRCLFRAPGSRNFCPQSSQGFFCSSICCFSSSVRVPSLILCLRVCRFKPSFWIKPSPHLSHLNNRCFAKVNKLKISPVRSFTGMDFPVPLQHLYSHKTVATEVASKRFLVAMLPNRMQSQIITTGEPLQTCLKSWI